MQTFLPYEDFSKCAKVLDRERLGKQRVECKQIFNAMYFGGAWENHPAVRMWRGYGAFLYCYYWEIFTEWKRRGYKHNMTLSIEVFQRKEQEPKRPPWLGSEIIHASHRNILVAKNPEHYGTLFKNDPHIAIGSIWPVDKDGICNFNQKLTIGTEPLSPF